VNVSGLPGRDQPLLLKFTQNLKLMAKTGAAALTYLKDVISAEVKQPNGLTGAGFAPRSACPCTHCARPSLLISGQSGQIITRICRPRSYLHQCRSGLLMTTGNLLPHST
jgi:hypothetical protein